MPGPGGPPLRAGPARLSLDGAGFLTKGPVAVFFPAVASLSSWSQGALRRWRQAVLSPLGWLVFVLVAGPWYLAIYLDDGPAFFESFFLKHNVGRFGGAMHGHTGFFGYYFVALPLIVLPFTGWLLRLLPELHRAWSDPLDRFLWIWFLRSSSSFSFSGTKLPHYLLYGATPLFIRWPDTATCCANPGWPGPCRAFFHPDLLALPWVIGIAADGVRKDHELAMLAEGRALLDWHYLAWVGAAAAGVLGLALWPSPPLWQRLILAGLVQTLVVFGAVVPRVMETMQGPVKEAALLARTLDLPTVVFRTSMPSFSVYRGAITPGPHPQARRTGLSAGKKLGLLARELPDLEQALIYRRGPVALVLVGERVRQTDGIAPVAPLPEPGADEPQSPANGDTMHQRPCLLVARPGPGPGRGRPRTPLYPPPGAEAWLARGTLRCLTVGVALWLACGYHAGFDRINAAGVAYPDWVWQWLTALGDERVPLAVGFLFARRGRGLLGLGPGRAARGGLQQGLEAPVRYTAATRSPAARRLPPDRSGATAHQLPLRPQRQRRGPVRRTGLLRALVGGAGAFPVAGRLVGLAGSQWVCTGR